MAFPLPADPPRDPRVPYDPANITQGLGDMSERAGGERHGREEREDHRGTSGGTELRETQITSEHLSVPEMSHAELSERLGGFS